MTPSSHSPLLVSFADLGVPRTLSVALERQGIVVPFPIQAATLPDCLAGRDVCGRAPTGSGKTLAFGLAVLSRIAVEPATARRGRGHPSALVLVPTRELAAQINDVMGPLAAAIGARTAPIYGGVGYGEQLAAIRRGTDVLIACPGRLADLVERGSVDLSHVGIVVIDEADRMADMGFLPVVRSLVELTSPLRQTLLFSATLDGPVDQLVRNYQHEPRRHEVEPATADRGRVDHHFWRVEAHNRVAVTAETITARGPAIVFCRTKRGADRLSDRLGRSGLQSAAIHGDRSQSQRERALAAFRAGRLDVLVATDVAARGIHVEAVPLVVHFDLPAGPTDYVHRSGRTGRAGASGVVVSLVGSEHLHSATLVKQKLGLLGAISLPDVSSLAVVSGELRTPDAQPAARGAAVLAVRAERPIAAPRTRAAGRERPTRRGRHRAEHDGTPPRGARKYG
ncbi:MAG TPA: DEAD/DEAH box helicase [Acidimicrobiales bacterium]|nr:DEAD/DEAH box helicase [Acidimicrobiales bacterium]